MVIRTFFVILCTVAALCGGQLYGAAADSKHAVEKVAEAASQAPQCAICYSDLNGSGQRVRTLPCYHVFHATCIDPWLKDLTKGCPVCRHHPDIPITSARGVVPGPRVPAVGPAAPVPPVLRPSSSGVGQQFFDTFIFPFGMYGLARYVASNGHPWLGKVATVMRVGHVLSSLRPFARIVKTCSFTQSAHGLFGGWWRDLGYTALDACISGSVASHVKPFLTRWLYAVAGSQVVRKAHYYYRGYDYVRPAPRR